VLSPSCVKGLLSKALASIKAEGRTSRGGNRVQPLSPTRDAAVTRAASTMSSMSSLNDDD
jgi:hypothetical protein